jgi:hypothetical protein
MRILAQALKTQGKDAETEKINRGTLALRGKVLEKEHPDILVGVYWLAYLPYRQQ